MKNSFEIKNKVILITGATSGIGKSCAIECSKMGAKLILIGRDIQKLDLLKNEIEGNEHIFIPLDITQYNKLENIIVDANEKLGTISGFIHSAGIEITKPLSMLKIDDYEKIFSINVYSGFELAKIISKKKFINPEGGSFVFISSLFGLLGKPGVIAYSATKGALISGVKSMALELIPKKIRVNCVLPAVIETEMIKSFFNNISEESKNNILNMHPMGIGTPEDVANACIFLLSDASKWITGTNLIVDGGYSAK
jgi:NAD(P)-dependent dehydrogenase (short-subunit alcohol dehydrogenase family)